MVAQHTPTPLPANVDDILLDYAKLHLHLTDLARKHGLSIDQLLDIVRDPEARRRLETLRTLADDRTDVALDLALPIAVDQLVDIMTDQATPHEPRRKAAAQIIRLHAQRRRERERRSLVPPTAASAVGAPASPPPPPAVLPNPKRERGAPSPTRAAPPESPAALFLPPRPSPIAQILNRTATPIRAP